MLKFKHWLPRVAVAVCCAFLGSVWVPAVAEAGAVGQQWAVVSADGTLVRSNGADAAVRVSTGTYEVAFGPDLTGCAYIATVGDPAQGEIGLPAVATVASLSDQANAVFVQTWDQTSGLLDDVPFHPTTYCDARTNFAVVRSDGSLARGPHVVSSGFRADVPAGEGNALQLSVRPHDVLRRGSD